MTLDTKERRRLERQDTERKLRKLNYILLGALAISIVWLLAMVLLSEWSSALVISFTAGFTAALLLIMKRSDKAFFEWLTVADGLLDDLEDNINRDSTSVERAMAEATKRQPVEEVKTKGELK